MVSDTVGGCEYRFEWVEPDRPSVDLWDDPGVRSPEIYSNHINPIYNFQEDVPAEPPVDNDWLGLWKSMATRLEGIVQYFALVAYEGELLAGSIRFLPKTLTKARFGAWGQEQHREEWRDDILWIGAASVDIRGSMDGLDLALLSRVIDYARTAEFGSVQAMAWSDIPVYAMWGQGLPISTYRSLGFEILVEVEKDLNAFSDMLAGGHGEPIQQLLQSNQPTSGYLSPDVRYIVSLSFPFKN
jgi:hypothetical protein